MTDLVVTSFSRRGEEQYGKRMVKTFRRHWQCPLIVYVEGQTELKGVGIRQVKSIPGWKDTRATLPEQADNPAAFKPAGYLWNAKRFAVKPFVWLDAARQMGAGVLTWLDGDTYTVQDVPPGFTDALLGRADVVYLGRGAMHPETGFVGFRIPEALPLLDWCCQAYQRGTFRAIPSGWTDCHVLRAGLKALKVRAVDLTSQRVSVWNSRDDAMRLSPLGPYVVHLKGGQRKREAAPC